jgi:hypothetical protein
MEKWLDLAWSSRTFAAASATVLLREGMLEQRGGASSSQHAASRGSGSSSGSSVDTADALAVLQAKHTLQWCCLDAVATLLAQFLHEAKSSDRKRVGRNIPRVRLARG